MGLDVFVMRLLPAVRRRTGRSGPAGRLRRLGGGAAGLRVVSAGADRADHGGRSRRRGCGGGGRGPGRCAFVGIRRAGSCRADGGRRGWRWPAGARIAGIVPISQVADLAPLMLTSIDDRCDRRMPSAGGKSPVHQPRPAVPVHCPWVGARSGRLSLAQARAFGAGFGGGRAGTVEEGRHHFDVVEG